jgi:Flp pilus assembly protein TadG
MDRFMDRLWRFQRAGTRGQSLVEFALVLPVFLLIVLVAIDFGRVFLAWVQVNNAVRIAANYAAQNPTGDFSSTTGQYQTLVQAEWGDIDCVVPSAAPTPSFPSGTGIGSPASVTITCEFDPITPLISNITGPVAVSGSAAFPIRSGAVSGIPLGTVVPTASPTASPSPSPSATSAPSGSPSPSGPSPTPTLVPTPSPTPMCIVPNFKNTSTSDAQAAWNAAGFTTNVIFNPLVPPDYTVFSQTPAKNSSLPCGTGTVTVSAK